MVELVAHDPAWAALADERAVAIRRAVDPVAIDVHHIGSTAIPGIVAKPVIDLLGVVADAAALDRLEPGLRAIGHAARGEYGLAGRRYFPWSDPVTGTRRVHLHCWAAGDPAVRRHLAFRDHLRADPALAQEYSRLKLACAAAYPHDMGSYCDCKNDWIVAVEAAALARA